MALILVVDDSLTTRRFVCKLLKAEGHKTMEAVDGRDALVMAAKHSPDCIVLDLIMPGFGGLDVLKALRDHSSKIPVVVLTADIQDVVREECLELGAAAFINKPMMKREMHDAIRKALDLE